METKAMTQYSVFLLICSLWAFQRNQYGSLISKKEASFYQVSISELGLNHLPHMFFDIGIFINFLNCLRI